MNVADAVEEGLEDGQGAIKSALDFFNDAVKDNLRDGFDAFSDIAPDIEQDIDEFIARLVVKLQRQEEFEIALQGLAEAGLAGLVDVFRKEGPATTKLINQILGGDRDLGRFIEMLIAENNPKFFKEMFGSELPPVFSDIEQQFSDAGGKIGASFNSGFQENALSVFGEAADFFTAENVPSSLIPRLLDEGNINMTKDDLMTFYRRVFLDSDVQSEIDSISAQLAGDFVSEFDKNLEGFATIIDGIQGKISKVGADRSLASATKRLNDLLTEQTEVTNNLADAQAEVDRLEKEMHKELLLKD